MAKMKQFPSIEAKLDFMLDHMQNNIREQVRNISKIETERLSNIKMFKK